VRIKREVRLLGFDDAPFTRADAEVPVVGVATRAGAYVEAVLSTRVARDGDDATAKLAACVAGYRGRAGLAAVLLQNLMVAGFNVVDLEALHAATGIPVVAVARGTPDLPALEAALRSGRIPEGEAKWRRIAQAVPRMVAAGPLTLTPVGLDPPDALALVAAATARGHMPEPLRLAHLIGAGWVLGQSRGQ
jgi:uncharacterized protein